MEDKMKALRLYGPMDMRLEERPVPSCREDEMVIRVLGCGICGSDLKNFAGGHEWNVPPEERFIETPVTAGHEFYGEIVEKGENVTDYELGELMISEQIIPCKECRFCKNGQYWMCQNLKMYGFQRAAEGGFAQYMRIHRRGINHHIPKHFTVEQAALIEPYACSMHAVERARIRHEDVVVVSGLGAIGLGMVTMARLAIPKLIIGLDLRENRRALAEKFGADLVLDPSRCDVVEEILKRTDGYGCDVYLEAAGSEASVRQGLKAVRSLGRYVQFGIFAKDIMADWNIIGDGKEIDVAGSHLGPGCFEAVIAGIERGLIATEGVVTHKFALEKWDEAYAAAVYDPSAVKVVMTPNARGRGEEL